LYRGDSQPSLSPQTGGIARDSVETNLLASRLEAINIELFKDPRIAKFFEKSKDDLDWKWWGLLVSDYDNTIKKNYKTVVEKVHAGVPRHMRGLVWQKLCSSNTEQLEAVFKEILQVLIACPSTILDYKN